MFTVRQLAAYVLILINLLLNSSAHSSDINSELASIREMHKAAKYADAGRLLVSMKAEYPETKKLLYTMA